MTPMTCMSLGRSLHRPPRKFLCTILKDGSDIMLIIAPVSTARDILRLPTWQGKAMMKAAMTDRKVNSTVCCSTLFLPSSWMLPWLSRSHAFIYGLTRLCPAVPWVLVFVFIPHFFFTVKHLFVSYEYAPCMWQKPDFPWEGEYAPLV